MPVTATARHRVTAVAAQAAVHPTLQPSGKTPEDVQRALDAVAKASHAIGGAPKTEHDTLLALLRIALMGLAARLTD